MKTAYVYSTDENYAKLTAVSMYSLLMHNPGASIVILANDIAPASVTFLTKLANDRGGTCEIIDVKAKLETVKALGAGSYVSFSAYARLFIPALLADQYSRAIYIDCDTLITSSLTELSTLNLHGKPFAIGYDCIYNSYKKMIGIQAESSYFNSGVLVMDLANWQARHCTERIFTFMREQRHDLMFGDQDYFSLVLANDAAILPPQYNFLTHFQMFRRAKDARFVMGTPASCWYTDEEFATAQQKPAIHHFLGHTLGRPWFKESKNPLRKLYCETATAAGVPEVAEQSRPLDFGYRVQWLCWKLLPRPLFIRACRAMYAYFFRTKYGV